MNKAHVSLRIATTATKTSGLLCLPCPGQIDLLNERLELCVSNQNKSEKNTWIGLTAESSCRAGENILLCCQPVMGTDDETADPLEREP